jgi:hypothetical protein
VTNTLFLHSMTGARRLLGVATWAGCTLMGAFREDHSFPLEVRSHCGASYTFSVVGHLPLKPLSCLSNFSA